MNREIWSSVEFYSTGDQYFSAVFKEIARAQFSICIETYIFSLDPMTRQLLEELYRARQRGVAVQIIVDGFGSYFWIDELRKICKLYELELRVYHPVPSARNLAKKILRSFTTRLPFVLKKLNRRNHRKQIIIDVQTAFLGSLNITHQHCAEYFKANAWKDFGARLTGPPLVYMKRAFVNTWNIAENDGLLRKLIRQGFDQSYDPRLALIRLNTSRKMRSSLKRDLLQKIQNAQHELRISTAYFLPRPRLLKALVNASKRGVRIELILPGKSDAPIVKWAAYRVLFKLLQHNVHIYEYHPSVLHSKYMLIDQSYASLGSTNFNHRSFLHDLEIEAVFTESTHLLRIQQEFEAEKSLSQKLEITHLQAWPWYLKIISRIAYRMRYLL